MADNPQLGNGVPDLNAIQAGRSAPIAPAAQSATSVPDLNTIQQQGLTRPTGVPDLNAVQRGTTAPPSPGGGVGASGQTEQPDADGKLPSDTWYGKAWELANTPVIEPLLDKVFGWENGHRPGAGGFERAIESTAVGLTSPVSLALTAATLPFGGEGGLIESAGANVLKDTLLTGAGRTAEGVAAEVGSFTKAAKAANEAFFQNLPVDKAVEATGMMYDRYQALDAILKDAKLNTVDDLLGGNTVERGASKVFRSLGYTPFEAQRVAVGLETAMNIGFTAQQGYQAIHAIPKALSYFKDGDYDDGVEAMTEGLISGAFAGLGAPYASAKAGEFMNKAGLGINEVNALRITEQTRKFLDIVRGGWNASVKDAVGVARNTEDELNADLGKMTYFGNAVTSAFRSLKDVFEPKEKVKTRQDLKDALTIGLDTGQTNPSDLEFARQAANFLYEAAGVDKNVAYDPERFGSGPQHAENLGNATPPQLAPVPGSEAAYQPQAGGAFVPQAPGATPFELPDGVHPRMPSNILEMVEKLKALPASVKDTLQLERLGDAYAHAARGFDFDQTAVLKKMRNVDDGTWGRAFNNQVIDAYAENHIRRFFGDNYEKAAGHTINDIRAGNFDLNASEAKHRVFGSIFEGVMRGYPLEAWDPVQILGHGIEHLGRIGANVDLVEKLRAAGVSASDLRPILVMKGSGAALGRVNGGDPGLLVNPDKAANVHISDTAIKNLIASGRFQKMLASGDIRDITQRVNPTNIDKWIGNRQTEIKALEDRNPNLLDQAGSLEAYNRAKEFVMDHANQVAEAAEAARHDDKPLPKDIYFPKWLKAALKKDDWTPGLQENFDRFVERHRNWAQGRNSDNTGDIRRSDIAGLMHDAGRTGRAPQQDLDFWKTRGDMRGGNWVGTVAPPDRPMTATAAVAPGEHPFVRPEDAHDLTHIPLEESPPEVQQWYKDEAGKWLGNEPTLNVKSTKEESLDPATLKTSQPWASANKLKQWEEEGKTPGAGPRITVLRTADGDYIVDGVHRAADALNAGEKVPATVHTAADLPTFQTIYRGDHPDAGTIGPRKVRITNQIAELQADADRLSKAGKTSDALDKRTQIYKLQQELKSLPDTRVGELRVNAKGEHNLWLSNDAVDMMKYAMNPSDPNNTRSELFGVNLPKEMVPRVIANLNKLFGQSDSYKDSLPELINLLHKADAAAGKEGITVTGVKGRGIRSAINTAREELIHAWQRATSHLGGIGSHLTYEAFRKLSDAIPSGMRRYLRQHYPGDGFGDNRVVHVLEAGAKLLAGKHEEAGVSTTEAAGFLGRYLAAVIKEHGAKALDKLDHAVGVAKKLKEKYANGLSNEGHDSGSTGGASERPEGAGGVSGEAGGTEPGGDEPQFTHPYPFIDSRHVALVYEAAHNDHYRRLKNDLQTLRGVKSGVVDKSELEKINARETKRFVWNPQDYVTPPEKLSGTRWVAKTGDGTNVFVQGDMAIHPEYAQFLMNQLSLKPSVLRADEGFGKFTKRALGVGAESKAVLLALSPFHLMQEGLRGIMLGVNPLKIRPVDNFSLDAIHRLEKGVEVANDQLKDHPGSPEHTQNVQNAQKNLEDAQNLRRMAGHGAMFNFDRKALSEHSEGLAQHSKLIGKIPVLGKTMDWYQDFLFNRYMPSLKRDAALRMFDKYKKANPTWTPDAVAKATAEHVNNAFGGQDWRAMGRAAATQDWFHLFALAPDWLESEMRFAASTVRNGMGNKNFARQQVLLMAAGLWGIARVLNGVNSYLSTGTPNWHLEAPFGVATKDKDGREVVYSMRTMPTDILHMATDPMGFLQGRLSPVTHLVQEATSGRDMYGRKLLPGQVWVDALRNMAPIPIEQIGAAISGQTPQVGTSGQLVKAFGGTANVYQSVAQKTATDLASQRNENGLMDESAMRRAIAVSRFEDELRSGTMTTDHLDDLKDYGNLPPKEHQKIMENLRLTHGLDPTMARMVAKTSRLDMPSALKVWDVSTPVEKAALLKVMQKKKASYMKKALTDETPQERQADPTFFRVRKMFEMEPAPVQKE
jgi:hypothetical protein